jgi:hypothetical protein
MKLFCLKFFNNKNTEWGFFDFEQSNFAMNRI